MESRPVRLFLFLENKINRTEDADKSSQLVPFERLLFEKHEHEKQLPIEVKPYKFLSFRNFVQ